MEDRKAYIEKITSQLKIWDAELRKLEAKTEKAGADLKLSYQKEMDALRLERDKLKYRLNDIRESSDEAWEELKGGFEKSLQVLNDSLKAAISKLN